MDIMQKSTKTIEIKQKSTDSHKNHAEINKKTIEIKQKSTNGHKKHTEIN